MKRLTKGYRKYFYSNEKHFKPLNRYSKVRKIIRVIIKKDLHFIKFYLFVKKSSKGGRRKWLAGPWLDPLWKTEGFPGIRKEMDRTIKIKHEEKWHSERRKKARSEVDNIISSQN